MNASLHRRSTASARLRENRPQSTGSGIGALPLNRRKSRSPDGRNDDGTSRSRFPRFMKQKRVVPSDNAPASRPSSTAVAEEERGRKTKYSLKTRTQPLAEVEAQLVPDNQTTRRHGKARRKDRSLSREAASSAIHSRRGTSPEPQDMDVVEERLGSGSLAAVDYVRMRDEIDALKKVC